MVIYLFCLKFGQYPDKIRHLLIRQDRQHHQKSHQYATLEASGRIILSINPLPNLFHLAMMLKLNHAMTYAKAGQSLFLKTHSPMTMNHHHQVLKVRRTFRGPFYSMALLCGSHLLELRARSMETPRRKPLGNYVVVPIAVLSNPWIPR